MAGRELPGHHGTDSRWLVDRQVYERRHDGVRYVTWTRSRQLGMVWLVALLLILAGSAGAASVWAWHRFAPDLIAAVPESWRSSLVAWSGGAAAPLVVDQRVHELEAARDVALRERDAARARLAELAAAREAAADVPEAGRAAAPAMSGAASPGTSPAASDPALEMTLLRHERDAARQQIDALMQLTAQLKAELAAGRGPLPAADGVVVDGAAADAREAGERLEGELASARDAAVKAVAERDRAQASLREAEVAARALQSSYDRLAGRMADAEQALAIRDQALDEGRKAAESAVAAARQAAVGDVDSAQAALRGARDELAARAESVRTLESSVAALQAERSGLQAELDRVTTERDRAIAAERGGREERDAMASRLQSLDEEVAAGEPELLKAERDRLAAHVVELQASLDEAKAAADDSGRKLMQVQGELAGSGQEAEGLRQALETVRAELALKDEALSDMAALQARLALAETRLAQPSDPAASSVAVGAVPMATWTIVDEGAGQADDSGLRQELATALSRIKELAQQVAESERRMADLERYLGDIAPPPPLRAPREQDGD